MWSSRSGEEGAEEAFSAAKLDGRSALLADPVSKAGCPRNTDICAERFFLDTSPAPLPRIRIGCGG